MNLYVNYTLMSDIRGNDSQLDKPDPVDVLIFQPQNRTEIAEGLDGGQDSEPFHSHDEPFVPAAGRLNKPLEEQ